MNSTKSSIQEKCRFLEFADSTPLVRSRYLRTIKSKNAGEAILYHSLFGNLQLVRPDGIHLLAQFSQPTTPANAFHINQNIPHVKTLIRELYELFYLVPEHFDERNLTKNDLWERAQGLESGENFEAIQLNVSEGCNLKCTYCFADRVDERVSSFDYKARNDTKLMNLNTAIKAVTHVKDLAQRNQKNAIVIKFFGREPLLNWKIISHVIDFCEQHSKNFQYYYTITTNGTLLTPHIIEKLKQARVSIVVSLDGFAQGNVSRLTHAGQESFSAVDRGLKLLHDYGITCAVASVLSEQNFESMAPSFLDYLHDRSVKQWEIKLLMQNEQCGIYSTEDYSQKLCELYTYGQNIGLQVTGDWYDPFVRVFHTTRKTTDDRVHRLAPNSCSATDHQLSIEPSGNIYGCRALDKRLGNIDTFIDVFKNPQYKNLAMRTYYNVPGCHNCKLEGFCQGVCLGHSERKFHDIYQPDDAYCDIYRAVFNLLLQKYAQHIIDSLDTAKTA